MQSLKDSFLFFYEKNKFEKNTKKLEIIDLLDNFHAPKKSLLNFFLPMNQKLCFYLYGQVGVGKTMIFNHYYKFINIAKQRLHFNEFMINFHDYRHKNKKNSITSFVQDLKKKNELIYLDEFQVTNIVDAMILGKLFKIIFQNKIKVLITSNTNIDDLYKDGLQRDQFMSFISIIKKNSIHKELVINQDYRKLESNKLERVFYPINEKNTFKMNQLFRKLTKNKKLKMIKLNVKGREFIISNFYDGIVKFDFKNLCDVNVGAEDYISIANICKFILIENIPNFNDLNINQQQRFITLIDILYEKKISLMISVQSKLNNISSSNKLAEPFKRTLSRLFELTSKKDNFFSKVV